MEAGLASKNDILVKREADKQQQFWFPVAMGVATPEQIQWATEFQLQVYNEAASQVYKLTHGGAEDG